MLNRYIIATSEADKAEAAQKKLDAMAVLKKALARAGQGGIAGAAAMAINVCTLMWIRTTINYQYRYGSGTVEAFKKLYAEGEYLNKYSIFLYKIFIIRLQPVG